ncbi:ATP-binding protein [Streptomyces sp. SID5785]|uniref:ATP-binding protein n=1 Tax=Streptomyces sp. SID5785 TaxID=2690309 RepID=UPI0031B9B8C3
MEPAAHLVAELAANAVTHGRVPGRDFALGMYVTGGALRIEVTDTRADRLPRAGAGRGLTVVAALAERWGVVEGPAPRKTVWCELAL